jgi:drug/metabolite transporter (DMT)-like permease
MSFVGTSSLLLGEGLLSLYPVLVRNIETDLLTHTLTRLITTVIVCYPFTTLLMTDFIGTLSVHIVSILYMIHIWSSYLGFLNLDVGTALTIFYIYPVINVVINSFLAKSFDPSVLWWFFFSFLGVIFISLDGYSKLNKNVTLGIISVLIAAVTESLIYIFYKNKTDIGPFNMLFSMCFTGSIILAVVWFFSHQKQRPSVNNPSLYSKLILANIILGVGGYLLRFYSVHLVTTEWFSILSYVGIIFGYLYGWIFYRETISWTKLIGTLMIFFAAYNVKSLGY